MKAAASLGPTILRLARGDKDDAISCLTLGTGVVSSWLQVPRGSGSSGGLLHYSTRGGADHAWLHARAGAACEGLPHTLQADGVLHQARSRPSWLLAWVRDQSSTRSAATSTGHASPTPARPMQQGPAPPRPSLAPAASSSEAASLRASTPASTSQLLQGSATSPSPAAAASTSAPSGMEQLVQALIQPLPVGRVQNSALSDLAIQVNRTLFLDPAKTLESTMRALYVIKRVLQDDGHVMLLNSNPLLQPLLREAALCCINSNVWFMSQGWDSETLSGTADSLFKPEHQPNRQLLAARGISLVNPHCMQPDVLNQPAPKLHMLDKWKLLSRRARDRQNPMRLLRQVVALEHQATRLPLPKMLSGESSKLRLLVVLDLSHDLTAVEEAYARNVMTVSLVNAHSDLSRITYPVYAGENHLKFQHFFLDWIIKMVNMPPPGPVA